MNMSMEQKALADVYRMQIHWGSRERTLQDCSRKVLAFLRQLERLDPVFCNWIEDPWQPKESRVVISRDYISDRLREGIVMSDIPRKPMMQLGYSMRIIRPIRNNKPIGLNISCGGYGRSISNSVSLSIPSIGSIGKCLMRPARAITIFGTMIECWDPDRGRITTSKLHQHLDTHNAQGSDVGWITYLATRECSRLPQFEQGVELREVRYGRANGHLIISRKRRFEFDDADHLRVVESIQTTLHGFLGE